MEFSSYGQAAAEFMTRVGEILNNGKSSDEQIAAIRSLYVEAIGWMCVFSSAWRLSFPPLTSDKSS